MDMIRWLVQEKFNEHGPLIVGITLLGFILGILSLVIFWPLAIVIFTPLVIAWFLVIYVHVEDGWKSLKEEYKQDRGIR